MTRRILPVLAALCVAGVVAGCSDEKQTAQAQAPERPPAPVSVVIMKESEQPLTTVLPGRASAFQTAEIRPRVTGIIREITFKEGSEVQQGDLLYQIEDDTYVAEVAQARASLAKAEASVPSAQANLARYERLVNSGATQIEYENAKVTLLQAEADVAQAKAALQAADINLNLTKIRAPFNGITTSTSFSIGNVVTANQSAALTTLRRIDPIYIDLIESSANLLRLRTAVAAGSKGPNNAEADLHLTLENGTKYPHAGKVDMSDMAVSETTGTYYIRAQFDNPDDLILPGMYVRATLTIGKEKGFLIPQRAADRNPSGELTAKFVSEKGTVETRTFAESSQSGNSWLVTTGVKDGDKLIVDGFQWIGDGAPIAPVEVTIDDKGLVVTQPAAPAAAPAN
ncbi:MULTISPECIES: efflux RND transporter periplasmic adaptor subunit [Rhizobium/Agrobacterium group]|jgi:membrane fusion protein (multidrug efflux system)|uniref:efflux RND transporter periplasmic adaptor subunit n=1 Tax=Rhizobium/Agrobacterium group TaxID=227290 RepID=UPI00216A9B9F|nr:MULTISPECIES: efflux RND transporter periplasmic adaptor subunit [Rhizobium/Agrobacterium group]MCS4245428.1 membrane fusion protein (multidrug efflux system) [Rhizobium sp. BIGb0125]MDO5893718.1 efflux RND transporter periplasmic adaptor subunit [Agrobacterium sp. Azo12]